MPKEQQLTRRPHRWKRSKAASAALCVGPGAQSVTSSTLKMESMQLSVDRSRNMKRESFSHLKLFVKSQSGKRESLEDSSSNPSTPSPDISSVEDSSACSSLHPSFRKKLADIEEHSKWTLIQTRGTKPSSRFYHAAAVVGRKLIIIGGETASETEKDVQMLHLGKLTWAKIGVGDSAPSKGLPIKTGPAQELPPCKGHSLISWGKTVILIGGQMDPPSDKITVWSFDLEMDCWTTVVTKGEIPISRSGHSVIRAGSILIMFGGEDMKGRKLNDLFILDLKSLMWLPLHPSGKGPSPRAKHVADVYDDRFLLIFGGETRTKISNDVYALDFDNMEWSKPKTNGIIPTPRAGHAGSLVGNRWYIAGGVSRGSGILDTTVLDMSRMEWSVVVPACPDSVASLQGLSLTYVHRKEKTFLVAFGGYGTHASNSVQVLHIPPEEEAPRNTLAGLLELPTTPVPEVPARKNQVSRSHHGAFAAMMGAGIPCACVSVAKTNLVSVMVNRSSSQRSSSRSFSDSSADLDRDSGLVPLRKRYAMTQSTRIDSTGRRSTSSQSSSTDTMARRQGSQGSSRDLNSATRRRDQELPKFKDPSSRSVPRSEGSERPLQSALKVRGDSQCTESKAPSVDSGLLREEDLQITASSVHPGLVSGVADAGPLFPQTHASASSGTRSCKGGSQSSEFSGYAETFVSGTGEEHNSEPSIAGSTRSSNSNPNMSSASTDCPSSNRTSNSTIPDFVEDELRALSNTATPDVVEYKLPELCDKRNVNGEDIEAAIMASHSTADMGEDELTVLSRLQISDCAEERNASISKLRQYHERKLAAAIRTGELLAGKFAEALRNRDEAELTLHTVNQSRQHTEGKLASALQQIKDLQDRLLATEQAREESNSLVHNARVENLKLEHDLAFKNASLGESQKELQATRGVLIAEGTRAFQMQVELFDVKHKLQSLNSRGLLAPCMQQPILA